MNGKNLFLGMSHIHSKYIEEAETVTELKGESRHLSLRLIITKCEGGATSFCNFVGKNGLFFQTLFISIVQ